MNILYITYPLSALLIFGLVIGLGISLTRKFRLGWRLFWIGAGTFILSQVGHIPFNYGLTYLFQQGILPSPPVSWALIFNSIVLGLSAGLWEEGFRYAAYRWWAKDARSWARGLLLGAGHGGIEAIITGLLILTAYISMVITSSLDLQATLPPEQLDLARQQIEAYWSTPWYLSMFGFLERALVLPVHLALSLLVLQTFLRNQKRWLLFAVLFHTAVNAFAVFISQQYGIIASEAVLALFTLAALGIIIAVRQPEPVEEPLVASEPVQPVQLEPEDVEETLENLEKSRYSS
jgi:uncharacterized membrane protein YhfC